MTVRGVDYSHWQSPPNTSHPPDVRRMKAAGIEFVLIKAWEGSAPDPEYKANLAAARADDMPALAYVWLHASDTPDRMQDCFDHIDGAVLCLDWEQDGVPSSIVEHWMDAYEAFAGREGMAYYGLYPPDEPTQRIGRWPRWFPEYCSPSNLKLPPWDGEATDWRGCWAIWQSSESGHVDGIEGDSDLDQLAPPITIDDFRAWLNDGTPLPSRPDVVKPAIRLLQLALNHMGYDAGAVDGLWGKNTQAAIERYSGFEP
jgi:GH25 family lysozyme M1 (1,4-beta-N-acetylmuramidase)